ncbi:MAG: HlyC/CorC family transporter [Candidatus Eisenbacteria bacterium]|nr:HlyC/CorC family transporter [Candidatus Eisenbacteria bacterium]
MAVLFFYVALALGVSFLCSIAEAVLLSVSASYIVSLEREGRKSGRVLRRLKSDVERPLAAILSLNTIAHTIGAAGAGAQAAIVFGSRVVGLVSVILTLLILFLSEIIPKTIGATYWRELAPVMGRIISAVMVLMYPFVVVSGFITRSTRRKKPLLGLRREEFAAMADLGREEGQLRERESKILHNLFRLRSIVVSDVMTPRTVVFALPEEGTVAEYVARHGDNFFSRIPVYRDDLDHVTGFVLRGDVLNAHARGRLDVPLAEIARPIPLVFRNKPLSAVYDSLVGKREKMAVVLDEHGGTAGIVTLEDVIETLLGLEIVDEMDRAVDMRVVARRMWEKRAKGLGIPPEAFGGDGWPSEEEDGKDEEIRGEEE